MQELQIMKDMWRYLVWWFVKEQGKINYNVCNMKTQSQPQAVFALCHHLTLSSLMLRTCQQPCTDWSAFSLLMDKQAFAEFININSAKNIYKKYTDLYLKTALLRMISLWSRVMSGNTLHWMKKTRFLYSEYLLISLRTLDWFFDDIFHGLVQCYKIEY